MRILQLSLVIIVATSCNSSSGEKKKSGAGASVKCVQDPNYSANGTANNFQNNTYNNGTQYGGNDQYGTNTLGNTDSNTWGSSNGSMQLQNQATQVTWNSSIKAIMDQKCVSCHNDSNTSGGVNLTSYQLATPHFQEIVTTVNKPQGDPDIMPQSGPLPSTELQLINSWQTNQFAEGTSTLGNNGTTYNNQMNQSGFQNQGTQNYNSSNVSGNCPPGMMDATAGYGNYNNNNTSNNFQNNTYQNGGQTQQQGTGATGNGTQNQQGTWGTGGY